MKFLKPMTSLLAGTCIAIGAMSTAGAAPAPKLPLQTVNHAQLPSGIGADRGIVHLAQHGRRHSGRRRAHRRSGYRRGHRRWRRHHRRRYYGSRWIGPAIASIIIGGAIASSKRDYRDRWERCDDRYKTFRWSDGTYIPYVGSPRRLCPYLRR